jgi:hypothetical protein
MADGLGSRWNHPEVQYKQLIDINGTPLVIRTINQLANHNIILVAPEYFESVIPENVALTSLGYRDNEKRPLLDGILRTKKWWTDITYILLGDVVYSNAAIECLFNIDFDSWVLGRTKPNKIIGKQAGELFSLVFSPEKEDIEKNLKTALSKPGCTGKLWDYYFSYQPPLLELNDYTDDIDSPEAYEQFSTILRWSAAGVVLFLWALSVKWSAAGLQARNPDDPNTEVIGYGLALFVTVAQLIFNRGAINPTLFVVGLCAYAYGIGTNIVGINETFQFNITVAAFSVNPIGSLVDLLILGGLAFVIELAPEAYLLWALNPKLQRPGDAISTILGRKAIFNAENRRSGTQKYQNQKYPSRSERSGTPKNKPEQNKERSKILQHEAYVLSVIDQYFQERGKTPSYAWIVQNTPLTSKSQVGKYMERYKKQNS